MPFYTNYLAENLLHNHSTIKQNLVDERVRYNGVANKCIATNDIYISVRFQNGMARSI